MSQPTYRYSDTAITQGIEAIRIAHNRIDTALDELERYADTQLQAWDGNTRQTYNEYKASWDQSVNNMKDIMLRGAVPSLQNILSNYNQTERINSAGWQQG
ncbi:MULTISPECIES: WXG100 family type VII secretion target [Micromonospora]|uniref:WXG100 family type VII secretion target n=1 Tax=Micromonospora rubida TaxID=2697657 RepID=A0ABW7SHT5_9ACTN